jgi:hypothetical protein
MKGESSLQATPWSAWPSSTQSQKPAKITYHGVIFHTMAGFAKVFIVTCFVTVERQKVSVFYSGQE